MLTLYTLYQFRRRVQESTQILRELEISLRTNHIGWVSPMWVQYDFTIDADKKLITSQKLHRSMKYKCEFSNHLQHI